MKTQRRHELKQNVLGAELGRIVDFFRRRGNAVAWGVLIAVVVVVVAYYAYSQRRKGVVATQSRYDQLVGIARGPSGEDEALSGFKELADQNRLEWVAADSCARVGDIYARRMMASTDAGERRSLSGQAASYYRKAIADFPKESIAVAKAHFGLAKLAETAGDFEAARKEYQQVLGIGKATGYPVMTLAQQALGALDRISKPLAMATTAPASQPASGPATQPASAPATTPAD